MGDYEIVGGGFKKVLYTLNTVRRIGVAASAKALNSHNACKACGLGMGGQRGGMTNELGEYPAVCNKSVQAQSTDIQPAIPAEIFEHPLNDFKQLSGREMEQLGRLNTPLYKPAGGSRFEPVEWDWALDFAADKFAGTAPERSFFYSSGRSSNEAGFVLQLLARLYGTNNVNNCSYYCHQASGEAMANTIGTGTATVELDDLSGCDLIFVIGANPASNHPRFIHKLQALRERGGHVVVINPAREPGLVRFAVPRSAKSLLSGGSWIASEYLQPNIGSDVLVCNAIAKAVLEKGGAAKAFIDQFCNGYDHYRASLDALDWPQLCETTGLSHGQIDCVAELYCAAQHTVFAWGMGVTHHLHGVQNVEAISNLALLRGMVGKRFAGLLPLRGHSNVQGIGTIGVKPVLPQQVFDAIEQTLAVKLPTSPGLDTLACLTRAHSGEIDCALMMGGNLFEGTPNSQWAEQALNRIGFKLYLTTTLNRGHVHGLDDGAALILPVTARDEEWQPTTQESMFNFVRLSDGGIGRLGNVKPEVEILCQLGKRLLPRSPLDFSTFSSHDSIRKAIAATVPGMEQLADIAVAKREFHIRGRLLHTPQFKTCDGRANFVAHDGTHTSSASAQFPLLLMSVRSEGQFNSIIYEERDSYRGTKQRRVIMLGEDDCKALGLKQGDRVHVRSAHGEMRDVEVHLFGLPKGNAMAYYPEANVLTGLAVDPRSKTPAFKSVPVAVEPA